MLNVIFSWLRNHFAFLYDILSKLLSGISNSDGLVDWLFMGSLSSIVPILVFIWRRLAGWLYITRKSSEATIDSTEPPKDNDLHFRNTKFKAVGRRKDLKALYKFCRYNKRGVRWMLLKGEGGSGKSKLALDLSRSKRLKFLGWVVCMPPKSAEGDKRAQLDGYSKKLPTKTLFVLDYAEYDASAISAWINGLASSRSRYKPKVRCLLIQRRDDAFIMPSKDYMYPQSPHSLSKLDEESLKKLMKLYESQRKKDGKASSTDQKLDANKAYKKLKEIDESLMRPLYAMAIADAFITKMPISGKHSLLKYIYNKEKEITEAYVTKTGLKGKENPKDSNDNSISACVLLTMKMMATMAGRFTPYSENGEYTELLDILEEENRKIFHPRLEITARKRELVKLPFFNGRFCEPLEPDIIGGSFVIEWCKELQDQTENKVHKPQYYIDQAWQKPYSMGQFVNRLFQDNEVTNGVFHPDSLRFAFDDDLNKFTCVNIEEGRKDIENASYSHTTRIAKVVMPSSLKKIGDWAFLGCKELEAVILSEGLECIGRGAFKGCSKLIDLKLPDSLNNIEVGAFDGCSKKLKPRLTRPSNIPTKQFGYIFDKTLYPHKIAGQNWIVLDVECDKNNPEKCTALLITEDIIETRAYNNEYKATNWKNCTLQKYLNEEFYKTIDEAHRNKIQVTKNAPLKNSWYGDNGKSTARRWSFSAKNRRQTFRYLLYPRHSLKVGEDDKDSYDYVFLLSLEECIEYFGDSGQLARRPSEGAAWISDEYNTGRQCKLKSADDNSWWWLRSPGLNSGCAASVDGDGAVSVSGILVVNFYGGVRPALRILL